MEDVPAPPPRPVRGRKEIAAVADIVGLDPKFVRAFVMRGSAFKPDALSKAGAAGLTQVMRATFESLRPRVEELLGREADQEPPRQPVPRGVLYRRHLDETNGDVGQAAWLYPGGTEVRTTGRSFAYGRAVA